MSLESFTSTDVESVIYEAFRKPYDYYRVGSPLDKMLITLCAAGNVDAIKQLLKLNVDVHFRGAKCVSEALKKGHVQVAVMLIKHGAKLYYERKTLLKVVGQYGTIAILLAYIDQGVDIYWPKKFLFECASRHGNRPIVKFMMRHIYAEDSLTLSGLREAAQYGHVKILRTLMRYGFGDPEHNSLVPLLILAVTYDQAKTTTYLVRHGVWSRDAIRIAIDKDCPNALGALLRYTVGYKEWAMHYAEEKRNQRLLDVLCASQRA